jgi:flavin reductase (DIM6/NTAB) family NADH-FMN oxidoreductase RutF
MTPAAGLSATAPDARAMRRVMGHFASGVTVVTTVTPDRTPAGCTVSAFTSLSLDPPLVLVCVDRGRYMNALLASAPGFAVSILRRGQQELALTFARPAADRFDSVATLPGRHGIPLIAGAIAHVECDREALADGGDHTIVIGRVRRLDADGGDPLIYSRGAFLDIPEPVWDRARVDAPHEWLLSAPW